MIGGSDAVLVDPETAHTVEVTVPRADSRAVVAAEPGDQHVTEIDPVDGVELDDTVDVEITEYNTASALGKLP